MLKKATRSGEVICFIPVELNTVKDGKCYMFIVMDVVSEFMFQAGIERGEDMEYVLKQIQQLLSHKDFVQFHGRPFTLVMSEYEQYRNEIERLIEPFGGTMVVDAAYIDRELGPAIDAFLSIVKNSRQ